VISTIGSGSSRVATLSSYSASSSVRRSVLSLRCELSARRPRSALTAVAGAYSLGS
jgi:hypothetical protein